LATLTSSKRSATASSIRRHERLEIAEQDRRNAAELGETKVARELQKAAASKHAELQALKAKLEQTKQDKQSVVELAEAKLVNELVEGCRHEGL